MSRFNDYVMNDMIESVLDGFDVSLFYKAGVQHKNLGVPIMEKSFLFESQNIPINKCLLDKFFQNMNIVPKAKNYKHFVNGFLNKCYVAYAEGYNAKNEDV